MMYYMQENTHNPPERYGDCMRTCVACLLDREPATVPNWFDPQEALLSGQSDPWKFMEEWLSDAGYAPVKIHVAGDMSHLLKYMQAMNPGVLYVLMGDQHAVIASGGEIIHDPSWLKIGVKEPSHMLFLLPASMRFVGE